MDDRTIRSVVVALGACVCLCVVGVCVAQACGHPTDALEKIALAIIGFFSGLLVNVRPGPHGGAAGGPPTVATTVSPGQPGAPPPPAGPGAKLAP